MITIFSELSCSTLHISTALPRVVGSRRLSIFVFNALMLLVLGNLSLISLQLLVPNISGVYPRHTTKLYKGHAGVFQITSLVTLCFFIITQCIVKSIPFKNREREMGKEL